MMLAAWVAADCGAAAWVLCCPAICGGSRLKTRRGEVDLRCVVFVCGGGGSSVEAVVVVKGGRKELGFVGLYWLEGRRYGSVMRGSGWMVADRGQSGGVRGCKTMLRCAGEIR